MSKNWNQKQTNIWCKKGKTELSYNFLEGIEINKHWKKVTVLTEGGKDIEELRSLDDNAK